MYDSAIPPVTGRFIAVASLTCIVGLAIGVALPVPDMQDMMAPPLEETEFVDTYYGEQSAFDQWILQEAIHPDARPALCAAPLEESPGAWVAYHCEEGTFWFSNGDYTTSRAHFLAAGQIHDGYADRITSYFARDLAGED